MVVVILIAYQQHTLMVYTKARNSLIEKYEKTVWMLKATTV